jgi:CDP-diacylglycerol--glycerol-3-phosphate 3-phosphatidyltransferase
MGPEFVGLDGIGEALLADQVDDRLAEAEDRQRPGAVGSRIRPTLQAPARRSRAPPHKLAPMASNAPPGAPRRSSETTTLRDSPDLKTYARDRLIESRLTPNAISVVGLIGNLAAAVLVTQRLFFLAGIAFILGSVMDTLDGRYSRMSGKGTMFGAFLDSTLDRIEEGVVLAAVAGYFAAQGDEFAAAMCVVAVLGSLMVSYTRARAEALGVECKVGIATRPVRVVILSIGLVFAKGAGIDDLELLAPSIYALAALTTFTAGQRVWHVRKALAAEPH